MEFKVENRNDLPEYSSGKLESVLILVSIFVLCLSVLPFTISRFLAPTILFPFVFLGLFLRFKALLYLTFPLLVLTLLSSFPYAQRLWPLGAAVALIFYFLSWKSVRKSGLARWFRRGKVSKFEWLAGFGFILSASVALLLWFYFWNDDLEDLRRRFPAGDLWVLLGAAIGFSVINAIVEEFLFRGIIMESLETIWKNGTLPLCIQTIVFGAMHLNGFPRGWSGMGLAAIYGLMTGFLRIRTGGILFPVSVHFFADLTIAMILLFSVR
ncbi:CPBP family intramembrane metalloprotease [Leptospira wolffii]|uniref:CPBP family intramembrane glutamic endopeptidase n=1 Tax=Leptospira wolffii TaxID=409998 RepID=UPI0010839357|nr:type II CAAX endopeptidase family protein [Leptospira wolffii]TGL49062.1 CPBP family intramembrane metalloprotease [Leptospira wolffii]